MNHSCTVVKENRFCERYAPVTRAFIMSHSIFGIISNISLGGISLSSVKGSRIDTQEGFDIFFAQSSFSVFPDQYTLVSKHITPGQAITIHHICFNSLSSLQLDTLFYQIKSSCVLLEDELPKSVSFMRQCGLPKPTPFIADTPTQLSHKRDTSPSFTSLVVQ